MPLIALPIGWTVLLDSIAWAIIQPAIGYLAVRLPLSAMAPQQWLFRAREWERAGLIYDRILRVKRWKDLLPSGGTVFRGFSMKRVVSHQRPYLERWVQETCRAELSHWLAFLSSALFFLWNPPLLGLAMVLYAAALNLPCIVVQRYNRPHLMRILERGATRMPAPPAAP